MKGIIYPEFTQVMELAASANMHYSLNMEKKRLLYNAFVEYFPRYGTVVELGVCHGSTGIMLSMLARSANGTYLGIDNWSLESSREVIAKHFINAGQWGTDVQLSEGSTHDPKFLMPYDFILIDAGHDEKNVSADAAAWIPWARNGAIVAWDDYPPAIVKDDAHWAVRMNADRYCGDPTAWELVGYWEGLLIKRKM